MKAKLLRDAGEIIEGTEVEIASRAGTNDSRSDKDVGGRSTTVAPVYEVTDDEGHAEKVDTRDLKPLVPDNRTHDDPTDAPRRHRG
jgi:hypothetical protein